MTQIFDRVALWRTLNYVDKFRAELPFGVNFAGYLGGEFGLAESARAFARALASAEIPYVLNNVSVRNHWSRADPVGAYSEEAPYKFNLIHVNAAESRKFLKKRGRRYLNNRYNIGLWYWELPEFPEPLHYCFKYFDEIWVTSHFCAESIAKVSPIPVTRIPYPFVLDDVQAEPERKRFLIPEGSFVFFFSFDFASNGERKNPLGLVRAFRKAFRDDDDVVLFIKSINAHLERSKWLELKEAARGAKIRLVDEYMTRSEFLSLMKSCDCYVSLHRSEGVGLGMAEAMCLGKPVIATGWSGNMDFMNHGNSFLVDSKLVELAEDSGPYGKGSTWAEPSLDHAAELMRRVFKDREAAMRTARRGAQELPQALNPEATGMEIAKRLRQINLT